jgi:hypothetical protein
MDEISRRSVLTAGGCTGIGLLAGCTSGGIGSSLSSGAGLDGKGLYYPDPRNSNSNLFGSPTQLKLAKPQPIRESYPDHVRSFPLIGGLQRIEQEAFQIPMENERRLINIVESGNIDFVVFECTYDQQQVLERLRANYGSMFAIDTSYRDYQILGSTSDTTSAMAFGPDEEGWMWNLSYGDNSIQEVVDDIKLKIDVSNGDGKSAIGSVPGLKEILNNTEHSLSLMAYLGLDSDQFTSFGVGLSEKNSDKVSANVAGYLSEDTDFSTADLKSQMIKRVSNPQDVDVSSVSLVRNDRLVSIKLPISVDKIPTY